MVDGPYGGIDTQKFFDSDRVMVVAGGSGAGWSLAFVEQFARCRQTQAEPEVTNIAETVSTAEEKSNIISHSQIVTGPSGLQSLRVILATRDTATRVWFHRTVQELLSKYSTATPDLSIEVFLTGRADQPQEIEKGLADLESSASSSSSSHKKTDVRQSRQSSIAGQELHGRPQLASLIHREASALSEAGKSLGVFACGPLEMQNDIRNAVAQENLNILKGSKAAGVYMHLEHFSWA